ncbi:MAG: DUF2079 domain-containing protein [Nitrososphaeria archaeon]|jgi:uncharacterized membrane protein
MVQVFSEEWLNKRIWKLTISEYIVIIITLLYGIIFSYYTILRNLSFRSNAWDLGIMVQSIASAAKGQLFINHVELYYSTTGSYFGVHFSPILFAVVPFFYLVPKVETVLIVQAFALALGAIPVYLIARHDFKMQFPALAISAVYLLSPSLQGINWYDFHPEAFLPLFILLATYFLKKRKPLLFLLGIILSLTTLEQASYFVALYAVYVFWEVRSELKESILQKKIKLFSLAPLLVFVMAISWAIFSGAVMKVINPNPPFELEALSNFSILNVNSLLEVPVKVITNPDLALNAIRFDFPNKMLYIILTFAPSGCISLLSPFALLPSIPWLVLSILSNYPPYYEFGFQYLVFTLPFVTIATIEGAKRLSDSTNEESTKRVLKKVSVLLLALGIILAVFVSPLSFLYKPGNYAYFRDYGISTPSLAENEVGEVLSLVPKDALIITTGTVFPQLSTDTNAYILPAANFPSPRLYNSNLEYLKTIKYDYIFITYLWDSDVSNVLYQEFVNNAYGLTIKGPGLELYKRGYTGAPINIALKFSSSELSLTNQSIVAEDASSESGNVILYQPSSSANGNAWYGPYVTLVPGNYTANFRIKFDSIPSGKIMKLDVSSMSGSNELGSLEIYGSNITMPFTWYTFSISFSVGARTPNVEFRGFDIAANVGLSLDYVEVVPL